MREKPQRKPDESPIEYFKRTQCCPDDYYVKYDGLYYCNPAHCSRTFTDEAERDKHLDMAYSILG